MEVKKSKGKEALCIDETGLSLQSSMEKPLLQVVMAQEGKWETFEEEDDEALSLSDLPVIDPDEDTTTGARTKPPEAAEEFEFLTSGHEFLLKTGEADMCAADEVFFQGQILPLRPSVSSDKRESNIMEDPSSYGWRSEPMDQCSSGKQSSGFVGGRSISRSHSTSSCSSACEPRRRSIYYKFYSQPSPKPHVCSRRKQHADRKSTSTSSAESRWGFFRLGLVKTPEIKLQDLSLRNSNRNRVNRKIVDVDELATTAGGMEQNRGKIELKGSRDVQCTPEKKGLRFLERGFHCRCSPDDAVDSISFKQGRKKQDLGWKGQEVLLP